MTTRKAIWLTWTLLLAGALMACNLSQYAPQPLVTVTPTEAATSTPAASPTPWAQRSISHGEQKQAVVCTGYDEGALNVRVCPGIGCWAFVPLYEGQTVTLDGQTAQTEDGATWVHITQPVDGWVNARYLCNGD